MTLQVRKASRQQARLKIGLAGPSGFGKTYSALLLARGLATSWEKVYVIDSENSSSEIYANEGVIGEFNVIPLYPPYTPEIYIEAIKLAESEGAEVIIIDSITHEWAGQGGILEIYDKLGGKFNDWSK